MRASKALTALVASILSIGPTVAAAQPDYTEIPLLASDGQMRDLFGFSVAATDDYVAVSAVVDDRYCCRPGFVYVFSRDDWTQQAQLQALDPVCVVRHHIASASAFVAQSKSAPACSHLIDASRKVEGTRHDFAGGPAAAEVRDRIIALRATLGCQ